MANSSYNITIYLFYSINLSKTNNGSTPGILVISYFIPPSTPTPPNLVQVVQEIVEKQVDDNSDNLTEQEKEQIKEEEVDNIVNDTTQTPQGKQVVRFSRGKTQMLSEVNTIQHLYIFQKRN